MDWHTLRQRIAAWILSLALIGMIVGLPPANADGAGFGTPSTPSTSRRIVTFDRSVATAQVAWTSAMTTTGAKVVKPLPIVNGLVVTVSSANAERALRRLPGVIGVHSDTVVHLRGVRTAPASVLPGEYVPPGVARIGAPDVWSTTRGGGIRVAILDTGIDRSHPDLRANVRGGYLAIRTGGYAGLGPGAWDDDNGHGTFVAGVVAAGDNGFGVVGVAPEAELYAIKALDSNGVGFVSDIIDGIGWAIDHKMQVVNMSFGIGADVPELHEAMLSAYNAGLVLVAAAGNTGPGNGLLSFPAQYLETIAVGAVDANDQVAAFSSGNDKLEMVAPGVNILSTSLNGGYTIASGTSMAAPHVTGTAALLLGARGELSPNAVKTILALTAENIGQDRPRRGFGLINARAVMP